MKDFETVWFVLCLSYLISCSLFWFSFGKKLLVLMSLELAMVVTVALFLSSIHGSFNSYLFTIILCCFLVSDSVLGVSLLISFSRSSSDSPSLSSV